MRGGSLSVMAYPRSTLVPSGAPGVFHCVLRCVRRAFLCGEVGYNGCPFAHRRQWVENRLREMGEIFAVSIWGVAPGILPPATLAHPCAAYGVMSNHLHVVVVQTLPETASAWSELRKP